MEIKASAKITMKTLEGEIYDSKYIKLLQEVYDMVEDLVEHINTLEQSIEEKEEEILELKEALDEAVNE